VPRSALTGLLKYFGLELFLQLQDDEIRGSFWGDLEAGIVGREVYARADTPVHSLLHETCHVISVTAHRRRD